MDDSDARLIISLPKVLQLPYTSQFDASRFEMGENLFITLLWCTVSKDIVLGFLYLKRVHV